MTKRLSEARIRELARPSAGVGSVLPVLPPRLALVEIALLLVLPILLEYFVPAFPDLTTFNPHPYWAPILLLSLQYGTVSGLLAAIIAIGGTTLIGLPEPDIGENHFAYMIRVWTQPFLWIIASLLLGHFRMQQIEHHDEMVSRVADLRSQSSALADYANNLQLRCDGLERRIASRKLIHAGHALESLASLSSAAPTELSRAFDTLIQAALPGAEASVFARDGSGLTLIAASGWPAGSRWRHQLPGDEPLAMSVVGEARSLSVLAAADEAALAGEGLLAVPIIARDTGVVVGVLKVEMLAAASLSTTTEKQIRLIAEQLGGPVQTWSQSGATHPTGPATNPSDDASLPARRWRQMRWFSGAKAQASSDTAPATIVKKPTVAGR
jgi:polysaccharide biosynthesis protein PelD